MRRPEPLLFDLQRLVVDLALINRDHLIPTQTRHENDIEHSFAVTMLCWFVYEYRAVALNLEKILKYALVHDFVERYAGDVRAYASKTARARKVELEKAALIRLSDEFKSFGGLVDALNGYETRLDEEALFVWTVDKMQALILGDLDEWRPYRNIIPYARFAEKHSEILAACSPYCKEIFQGLIEYCQTTYYDRPATEPAP